MDTLSELFTRHEAAAEAHLAQIQFTDAQEKATEEIWALQFAACDVEEAVALEICQYRPADPAEMDQKARFLMKWTEHTELPYDQLRALLGSMLTVEGEA